MHRLSRRSALLLALGVFAAASGSAAAGTIADYRLIVLDGASLKWGEPVDGTPATVTYSVFDDTRRFPDARNCGGLSPLAALLAANRIDRAAFDTDSPGLAGARTSPSPRGTGEVRVRVNAASAVMI